MARWDSRASVYEGSGWFWGQYAQFVTLGLRVRGLSLVARLGRVVAPGLPYHITQRGNRRENARAKDEG